MLQNLDYVQLGGMIVGFIVTVTLLKADVKELKRDFNGLGKKVSGIAEHVFENKIEIEKLKTKQELQK